MSDWKTQLERLGQNLQQKERSELEAKAAVLKAFRKCLSELEPILQSATEFGDAFGVDCEWRISRFDERHPFLSFQIRRPRFEYHVECRDGVLRERRTQGEGAPRLGETTLEALTPKRLEQVVTAWVREAAESNRKVPGKRH